MLQMISTATRMNTNCGSPMVGSIPVRVLPMDPTEVQLLASGYDLSVICQSASAAPDSRHQNLQISLRKLARPAGLEHRFNERSEPNGERKRVERCPRDCGALPFQPERLEWRALQDSNLRPPGS